MRIFKKTAVLKDWLNSLNKISFSVGFVPTMGALHQGHISLIQESKHHNSITVCSIFVNPAQFNDPKDFEKYPITIERDIEMLEMADCDVLFLPSVSEIYPEGFSEAKQYDLGFLETVLEGKYRPGHFQGVCRVVERLLEIVVPNNLYLGQKDYQQCMVIAHLVKLMDQQSNIQINICPTLREASGLAMSSRNMRLSEKEKNIALTIFQSLELIKNKLAKGDMNELKRKAIIMLEHKDFRIDYVEIADANTLTPLTEWDGKQKSVALIAVYLNEVRLIDNMILN
ncbi:MAG: pantoate--beta-alanine ligase [Bacteroidetes bacterium]|nr:pantoate--beta-alanine ligase [Bacteroidota bacterium]